MKERVKNSLSQKINYDFSYDSPKHFVMSQWQREEKCIIYLIYRWIMASFYVFSCIFSFATSIARGEFKTYFIYLTNWNLFASMVMTTLAAVLVTQYHRYPIGIPERMTAKFKFYWFLSISTTMYAVLISTIYWAVLFHQDNNVVDLNNILIHGTNSLLLIDTFVVKHRSRFSHFIWPLFCGFLYLILLTWLYTTLGGVNRRGQPYIYPILNWNEKPGEAFVSAMGVLIAGAIIHSILVCLQHMRERLHKWLFYEEYKTVSNCSTRNNLAQMEASFSKTEIEKNFILTC